MPTPDDYLKSLGAKHQPAVIPPGPRRPKWRTWLRRGLIGLAVLVVLLVVTGAWYGITILDRVSARPFSLAGMQSYNGRTNVLILGVGDPGHSGQNLSDTIMVMSFQPSTHQVAMISVPRDLQVNIPGYGNAKINTANAVGGSDLARKVVSQTLGIPIHYVITTNFSGLVDLVNAVGGIDVNVKQALVDPEYPCADNQFKACGLNIQPGQQHMDGATALEYARCRKGTCGNDFGRDDRQQEVIKLVMQKVFSPALVLHPSRLNQLAAAVRNNLTTDMSGSDMAHLALWYKQQKGQPKQLVLSTDPGSYLVGSPYNSNLLPRGGSFDTIQQAVANIFQ